MPQCSCGVGFGEFAGTMLLSITMGVPFFSLTWPLVTTCWPSFRPLRMATWSPRVSPVVTKACCTTRPEPDAACAGARRRPPGVGRFRGRDGGGLVGGHHQKDGRAVRVVGDRGLRQRQVVLLV